MSGGKLHPEHKGRKQLIYDSDISGLIMRNCADNPMLVASIFKHMTSVQLHSFLQKFYFMRHGNCVLCALPKQIKLLKVGHNMKIVIDLIPICSRLNQRIRRYQSERFSKGVNVATDVIAEGIHFIRLIRPKCGLESLSVLGRAPFSDIRSFLHWYTSNRYRIHPVLYRNCIYNAREQNPLD